MLGCSASVRAHHSEAVRIIDEDAEVVFLLESHDLVQNTECSCHTVHSFGNQQHAAAGFLAYLESTLDSPLAFLDVVVRVYHPLAHVQTAAVDEAGVGLGVVHDNIVAGEQGVDSRDDTLIAEVEKECVLLLLELSQFSLESLVQGCLTGHHPGAHGISQSPTGCGLGVYLADLGMVGQSEIVVEAPAELGKVKYP